jgi:glutaredoxin 3
MSSPQSGQTQAPVLMYSKDYCPYCVRAKQLLMHKEVEFEVIDVDSDHDKYHEMLTRSNGARTVPQIFIGAYYVGGSDQLYALHRQNKLDTLLFPEHSKAEVLE